MKINPKFLLHWIKYLCIEPIHLKRKSYLITILGIGVLFIIISILEGLNVGQGGDFTVFWYAGKNFSEGNDLYSRIGGAERFIYPPFAAMLFQLLALFPLKFAAIIYTFFNLLLYVFIVYLTRSIVNLINPIDEKKLNYIFFFALLLSFRFFWYHLMFIQMNELVLALCLTGILLFLKNKETAAVICFVIATFIKVIPIFFLIWMAFRGSLKSYLKGAIVVLFCVALPIVWRGIDSGIIDLQHYYTSFLEPFQQGRVEPNFQNYSLSAAIYKISLPMSDGQGYNYNLLHWNESLAKRVYFYSFLLIFILFLSCLAYLKFRKKKTTIFEVALILIVTHLLSGITWEYHLVSLLFVYIALIISFYDAHTLLHKSVFWIIIVIAAINAIVGRDTIGIDGYHYFGGFGMLTWMMVLLFFYLLFMLRGKTNNSAEKK